MPRRQSIPVCSGVFFVTFTCYRWIDLIRRVEGYDLVYQWFDYLNKAGHSVTGYVVMPNHVHALLYFAEKEKSINRIIGDGKRFMAYDIVRRLEHIDLTLLSKLSQSLKQSESLRGKKHKVWEPSSDWKHCRSDWFFRQKLEYIHFNPCVGKWKLVPTPEDYKHSSARYYRTGLQAAYPVVDIRSLFPDWRV